MSQVLSQEEWRARFKVAFDRWLLANGYKTAKTLSIELGIPDSQWGGLAAGTSISETEYYARIFARSNKQLKEADPTSLPARPRAGGATTPRAWSKDQLDEYLAGPGKKYIPQGSVQPDMPMTRADVSAPAVQGAQSVTSSVFGNIGLGMDVAMQQVVEIAADRIAQRLATHPQQGIDMSALAAAVATEVAKKQQRESVSMPMMLSMLTNRLDLAMSGSPEQRDALVREHGRAFGRILSMLNTLTKQRDRREAELEYPQEL
jgi:hypothetical protein